jgi:hypothetical protein
MSLRSIYSHYFHLLLLWLPLACYAGSTTHNDSAYKKIAQTVLSQEPFSHNSDFLIEHTEWQELALSRYVAMYDTTITAFGTWGLTKLTEPITNMQQIMERQCTLVQLDADPLLQTTIRMLLREISEDQEAMLAYFNAQDKCNGIVQQLYYPSWLASKISFLNTSKLALDVSYIHTIAGAVKSLAGVICMHGFAGEFMDSIHQGRAFEWKKIFTRIIHEHSLDHALYDQLQHEVETDTFKVGTRLFFGGSFGDKWRYARDITIAGLRACRFDYFIPAHWFAGIGTVCGGLLAVAERGYFDYEYATNIKQHYRRLCEIHRIHCDVQKRMVRVARCMKNMAQLINYWQQLPYFAAQPLCQKITAQLQDAENPMRQLLMLLQKNTFAAEKGFWYSRGDVLLAHKQMVEVKDMLVPLLQAVALTDGFMSIVHLYSTHKDTVDDRWCLVSFIDAPQPVLSIEQGSLPLLRPHSVANDCQLGSSLATGHMLITGPSGAGKSSYLKMVGGAVSCAQAWTIAPAQRMQLTPFARACTSFDPHEDISKGISTFMAQQRRLEKLKASAYRATGQTYTLLLIDEPYRGTIEAEAEKRAYQFCRTITDNPNAMTIMACHLQEPILLEAHTGRWCNKQVVIEQKSDQAFNCTYKIIDGPAWWWFNDLTQRINFIDWLLVK